MSRKSRLMRVDPLVYDDFMIEKKKGLVRTFPEYLRKLNRTYKFQKETEKSMKNISKNIPGWFK